MGRINARRLGVSLPWVAKPSEVVWGHEHSVFRTTKFTQWLVHSLWPFHSLWPVHPCLNWMTVNWPASFCHCKALIWPICVLWSVCVIWPRCVFRLICVTWPACACCHGACKGWVGPWPDVGLESFGLQYSPGPPSSISYSITRSIPIGQMYAWCCPEKHFAQAHPRW